MLDRIPAATSLRMVVAALVCSSALAAPARAQVYPWPANGAPLCNGAGNQHRLFQSSIGCEAMELSYVSSLPGADSLVTRTIGYLPPNGECPLYPPRVDATGVTEVSTTEVPSLFIAIAMPMPGCLGPPVAAQVWLQGSGAASQLVVNNPYWMSGTARAVADDGDYVRHHPRMASSGDGYPDTALAVVWSDERTGVPQIRAQRVTWRGVRAWGPTGIVIAPTGAPQTEPEITRLQDGSSLVVWLDERSGGSDVYSLRLLPDGTPASGWPATGRALESGPEVSSSLRLVGSGFYYGPRHVVWEETGPRFDGGRSLIARRLLPDGNLDMTWQNTLLTTSTTVEHLQDVSQTSEGLVVVWTDVRDATPENPTDLYAQWVDNSGLPRWPFSGLALCTAPGRQDAARVSSVSTAYATYAAFAWEDHRGADVDVYAELRNMGGTLPYGHWAEDGLPATSAPGDQTAPVVGAGNNGGCFVAWEDARDLATAGLDVYAQAFSSEGDKLDVPPGGVRVFLLGLPRPNPTHGSTSFTLQSPRSGAMRVEVLDVAGRRVRTLASGDLVAGTRDIAFDGRDDAGHELPPGVYRVRARVGDAVSSRTLIRLH